MIFGYEDELIMIDPSGKKFVVWEEPDGEVKIGPTVNSDYFNNFNNKWLGEFYTLKQAHHFKKQYLKNKK